MLRMATVAAIAAAVTTGVAGAVTPANGGDAGGALKTGRLSRRVLSS
jgi:hypothetical protein